MQAHNETMRICTWSSSIKFKVDGHWSKQLQVNWAFLKERRLQRFRNIEFFPSRPTTFGRPIISLDSRPSKLDRLKTVRRIVDTVNHTSRTMTIRIWTFQLHLYFSISLGSFQLRLSLSKFSETLQLQTFQLKTFQLLVLFNCPFQLHVSQMTGWLN